PVVLFSGGEPLVRHDLVRLAKHAARLGMRAVLSTNGTLLDAQAARALKAAGVAYVGISLDGLRETNDAFRGVTGAFDRALAAVRHCRRAGLKVGLRFSLTRRNVKEIGAIFDLARAEKIPRLCFYHLAYSGRGSRLRGEDLSHAATRRAVDEIIQRTADLHAAGLSVEVLTVDNHADGPYLYLRMRREKHPRAEEALALLRRSGGNASGERIAAVAWDGSVHPDQFWRTATVGRVGDRTFAEIWSDRTSPLLAALRNRRLHLTGRCARCRFLDLCGGNLRARAEAATGDPWAPDPACYLTDKEIGLPRAKTKD
ncbi:MAG: radical SAM protein, partial [Phycisphaerae bacterium]